jgi:hypothetical protein
MTECRQLAMVRPPVNAKALENGRGRILTLVPLDEILELQPERHEGSRRSAIPRGMPRPELIPGSRPVVTPSSMRRRGRP